MVFAEAITVVDMVATAVFAVSGALAAAETKSDALGIVFDLRLPKYGGADG